MREKKVTDIQKERINPISAGVLENQDKKFANLQKLNFLSQNPVKSSKNVCKKISNMQKFSQYFK